jgi:hypothetical protein
VSIHSHFPIRALLEEKFHEVQKVSWNLGVHSCILLLSSAAAFSSSKDLGNPTIKQSSPLFACTIIQTPWNSRKSINNILTNVLRYPLHALLRPYARQFQTRVDDLKAI